MTIDLERLWRIAPQAKIVYRDAFVEATATLALFDISMPLRAQHFLAQVLHESDALTVLLENLNYTAERLVVVWPGRFPTIEDARPFARNPRALANRVYGGRMGNIGPDDGWKFIGRGMLQITGRDNYEAVGRALGVDLLVNPDRVTLPAFSLGAAACVWKLRGCNAAADEDDVRQVTRLINGGLVGLPSRMAWLDKVRPIVEG